MSLRKIKCWLIKEETAGVQGRPAGGAPLWLVDYFEFKAIETLQAHETLRLLP